MGKDFTEITIEEMEELTRVGLDAAIAGNDVIALYLKEMRINPLLTHAEVVALFQNSERGSLLNSALKLAADSLNSEIDDIYDPDFIEEMSTVILVKMQGLVSVLTRADEHQSLLRESAQRRVVPNFTDDWREIAENTDTEILNERTERFKHVQAKNYGINVTQVLNPHAIINEDEALYPSEYAIGEKLLHDLTNLKDKGYAFSRMILSTLSIKDFSDSQIISSNWRLAVGFAKKQYHPDLFMHFLQAGNVGLVTARNKFDYRSGNQFSTYATWWVRQGVTREQYHSDSDLYIAHHAIEDMHFIYTTRLKNPGIEDEMIIEIYNKRESKSKRKMTLEKLRYLDETYERKNASSIDKPIDYYEDSTMADFIPSDDNVEDEFKEGWMRERVQQLIQSIPLEGDAERRRLILKLRYGIGEFEEDGPRTLEEVAEYLAKNDYGLITRERVRQLEANAMHTLKGSKKLRNQYEDII